MSAVEMEAWRTWPLPTHKAVTFRRWHEGRCAWCGHEDSLVLGGAA